MKKQNIIKTFARRLSRPLRDEQQNLFDNLLPTIVIKDTFPSKNEFDAINLEIGFGDGALIAQNALNHPSHLFIGAEPYLNGVGSLLKKIEANQISNIRIFHDDVRTLLDLTPNNIFQNIYIVCPDPWPKRKHLKRRLVNEDFLKTLTKYIKKDGIIHLVTDHLDYANWMLNSAIQSGVFDLTSTNIEDYAITDG
ncbi:MAG: tRNA (guanosine(46)-N7)-methyltransferase TrmB, partial [Alphaproteobacteria bacterium]